MGPTQVAAVFVVEVGIRIAPAETRLFVQGLDRADAPVDASPAGFGDDELRAVRRKRRVVEGPPFVDEGLDPHYRDRFARVRIVVVFLPCGLERLRIAADQKLLGPSTGRAHHRNAFFSVKGDLAAVGRVGGSRHASTGREQRRGAPIGIGGPDRRTRVGIGVAGGERHLAVAAGERSVTTVAHRDRQHCEPGGRSESCDCEHHSVASSWRLDSHTHPFTRNPPATASQIALPGF